MNLLLARLHEILSMIICLSLKGLLMLSILKVVLETWMVVLEYFMQFAFGKLLADIFGQNGSAYLFISRGLGLSCACLADVRFEGVCCPL